MKKLIIAILATVFGFSFASSAQAEVIKLEDFLKAYLQKSYKLKSDFLDVMIAKAQKKSAKGADDVKASLSGGYTDSKSGSAGLYSVDKQKYYSLSATLAKTVTATGTQVSVTHSVNYSKTDIGTSAYSSYIPALASGENITTKGYSGTVTLEVIQPILKNFFGLLDRLPIKVAALNEKIQRTYYEEYIEEEMASAISSYLTWLYLYRQKILLQSIIRGYQSLLYQTQRKVRAGIAERSDLEASRANVLNYQQQLLTVEISYKKQVLAMGKYMLIKDSFSPDLSILERTILLPAAKVTPNLRTLKVLDLSLQQLKLNLDSSQNSILPTLNLVGSVNLSGSGDDSVSKVYNNMKRTEFYLGFELSLYFSNRSARGARDEASAEYKQMLINIQESQKNLNINEKNLRNTVIKQKEVVAKQKAYIGALERKLVDQTRQYRRGSADLDDIISTRNSLSNARLQLIANIVDYHNYFFQYLGLVDKLSSRYMRFIPKSHRIN